MIKVALYSRYSDENQNDASIEQQERLLRQRAENEGWQVVAAYSDRALTGAIRGRPGLQNLLAAAKRHEFDILLSESVDRLSRDQEDMPWIYKQCRWLNIEIVTLLEGEVNELIVGLKGTMSALYLKDL